MTSETANPIQRRLSCSNRDSNSLLTLPNHAVSLASNCALSVAQDRIQAFLSLHVLHTHCNFASLPNCPHNPCLVHYSLSLATSANGCAREGDAPDLKLLLAPQHHHSHEGLPCRSLGLKCAQLWSEHPLEHWRGRPSLTRRPSFAIHLQVFRTLERRRKRRFCLPPSFCLTSFFQHAVNGAISHDQVYIQPLIQSGRPGSTAMRTTALVAMGRSVLFYSLW